MVGRPQVSIRLGTTGRGDVERDFAAIGDSGEAQARRYQAAWERASAEVERAVDKQAKAAARLEAANATPLQQRINRSTGVSAGDTGNAKAAAAALAQELDRAEREARQLIASIDPLFAAQARYTAQVERINAVKATGQLEEDRYQQLLAHEKMLLDQATVSAERNAQMNGQRRMGLQQLGFQLGDISTQMAMGTKASVIFAQQSGQTIQALQLMGGEGNKFLEFLRGPWGIALSVAAIALTPFIGKLLEANDATGELVEQLKKEAQQHAANDRAHAVFANTLDGVTEALRKNREALKGLQDQGKSAAEQALKDAIAEKMRLQLIISQTVAIYEQLKARQQLSYAVNTGSTGAMQAGTDEFSRLKATEQAIADAKAQLAEADRQITDATSRVYVEAVLRDPVERIQRHYATLIEQARARGLAEHKTFEEIARQTDELKRQRDAEIKAERERNKKGPANAGGTAIFNEQIASFFDTAAKYRGLSEHKPADRSVLEAFFKEANQDLDPEKVKWCAAFVNAVLAANGVKGTGSLAAKSFLTFGKDDTKSPQRGDIAVVRTKVGEHVGFVDSVDKAGNVKMLAGNTGDKVAEATYSKSQILAIRRPPTPSESAAAADKAASDALQATQAFDSEREKLNQQYLQALGKVVAGYDAQASVQLMRATAEHDAEAKEIATNLAAGKYGEATSQLAQTRAKQLQDANDQVLSERKAAIALDSYVKSLQAQDAANERDTKYKLDGLEYSQSIARTAGERRKLGQEIIDIEYKEKERHLQYLLALDQLLGNTEDAAKVAADLAHLPEERKRAEDQNNRSNQNPFEAYRDSLPNLSEAGDNVQSSIVSGLKSFNEGLDEVLMKSKNLKELWHNFGSLVHDVAQQILKDLIDLAIKMFVIKPIMNLIAGSAGGFATGTEYFPGGTAWVGEHGPELVRLPRGSKIHTAADSRRMAAANDAGPPVSLTNYNDFRGADPSAVAAISERLDQMEADLPRRIVSTMGDARTRFLWRSRF